MKPKTKKRGFKGWYYATTIDHFEGFLKHDELEPPDTSYWVGPFRTFDDAKNDAIQYHQVTINYAREAIAEIRAHKAPKNK